MDNQYTAWRDGKFKTVTLNSAQGEKTTLRQRIVYRMRPIVNGVAYLLTVMGILLFVWSVSVYLMAIA